MNPSTFSISSCNDGFVLISGDYPRDSVIPAIGVLPVASLYLEGNSVGDLSYAIFPASHGDLTTHELGFAKLVRPDIPSLVWRIKDFNVIFPIETLKRGALFGDLLEHESYAQATNFLKNQRIVSPSDTSGAARKSEPKGIVGRYLGRFTSTGWILIKAAFTFIVLASLFLLYAKTADQNVRLTALQMMITPLVASSSNPVNQSAPTSLQLDGEGMMTFKRIVQESSVTRPGEVDPFVIFSDPNCPSCRAFEQRMAALDWPFNPIIIPVSFQSGSADAVAGVLCAKDVGKAWDEAVSGKAPPACDSGRIQAQRNNDAFASMGLTSTPTFVAVSGKYSTGFTGVNDLLAWVSENTTKVTKQAK